MSYKKLKDIIETVQLNEETLDSYLKSDRFKQLIIDCHDDSELVDLYYERFQDMYIDEYGEDDDGNMVDVNIPDEESPEFKEYIIKELTDNVITNLNAVEKQDGKLVLYRMISFNDNYLEHLNKQGLHLGVYWTFSETSADVYFSPKYGDTRYILKGLVAETGVDWNISASLNLNRQDSAEYTEDEIRLIKGVPIQIVSLSNESTGEYLDISSIKNKTFYA